MTNLDPAVCAKLRDARKKAGLSQTALAREVGCRQSALCAFELGDGTKLNDAVIEALCGKFGIELPKAGATPESAAAAPLVRPASASKGFCPNPHCPSHHEYEVEGRRMLRPDRTVQDPVGGKFCAICGEVLEKRCPNCDAPLHEGAVCTFCGEPYVTAVD